MAQIREYEALKTISFEMLPSLRHRGYTMSGWSASQDRYVAWVSCEDHRGLIKYEPITVTAYELITITGTELLQNQGYHNVMMLMWSKIEQAIVRLGTQPPSAPIITNQRQLREG